MARLGVYAPSSALAGLAAGILWADSPPLAVPGPAGPLAAVVCLLLGMAAGRRAAGAGLLLAVALLAASVGAWRGTVAALPTGPDSVAALIGQEHELVGTVVDEPRPRGDRQQVILDELVTAGGGLGPTAVRGRLLVWLPRGIVLHAADRLHLTALVEEPRDFDGFAYRAFLARQGIGGLARAFDAEVLPAPSDARTALAALRSTLLSGLNSIVPEPEAALGAGILLGVRGGIAPEIDDAFATAGLTHVVAISGWNIAIVAALVGAAASPLRRRPGGRWAVPAVTMGTVVGYVLLTGASPSVVRAALMAAALLVARLGGSRAHATSALVLAAGIMLIAAPPVLWDVGFQLSVLATAGLIWFAPSIEVRLRTWPGWLREPVALTLAAQVTTLPVVVANFERLSLVAPLANVLVVPIVPIAMLACAVAACVGVATSTLDPPLIGGAIDWFAGGSAWLALRAMIVAGSASASVPFAAIDVTVPPPLLVAWYPLLGLATLARSRPRPPDPEIALAPAPAHAQSRLASVGRVMRRFVGARSAAIGLISVLVVVTLASRPDGRLHVTVLDIGQGDAILVETPSGATALIDGGPDPELTLRHMGEALPFFARRIDLVLLSHPHQDHVAGLVDVLARHRVGAVLHAGIGFHNHAYDQLMTDAGVEPQAVVALARAGAVVHLDAATTLEILYPTQADAAAPLPEGDINNGSVVALLRYGDFTALLTGDAEAPIERLLLERGLVPPIDVLKVGHHGSESSTTPELVAAARPGVAIISSGAGNEYGHPHAITLETLAGVPGLTTYRTDTEGDVEVVSDGRGYAVRTDRGVSAWRPVNAAVNAGRVEALALLQDSDSHAGMPASAAPQRP